MGHMENQSKVLLKEQNPETQVPIHGAEWWRWRLSRLRIEDLSWIARRVLRLDHTKTRYYQTPQNWIENKFRATDIALSVRGQDYQPAIFIHGVMPRSGTNMISDILDLSPLVIGRDSGVSELPFLSAARSFDGLYADILARHRDNAATISGIDILAWTVSGMIRDLQEKAGADRTLVLKMPSVQNISLFRAMFPRDHLVVAVRDGRDLLASSMDTWKGKRAFLRSPAGFAREWAMAVRDIIALDASETDDRRTILKFEDFQSDPVGFARALYDRVGLNFTDEVAEMAAGLPVRGSSAIKDGNRTTWDPVARPKDFKPVGRWRRWSGGERRRFARCAGPELIALGYEADDSWTREV